MSKSARTSVLPGNAGGTKQVRRARSRPEVRRFIAAIACALIACGGTASAQTFPTKPIRFVVPFAPGGSTDTLGRTLGQKIAESIGQQVVIDNRTGANGNIGMEI